MSYHDLKALLNRRDTQATRAIFVRQFGVFRSYPVSIVAMVVWPIPILALNIYQYLGLGSTSTIDSLLQRTYGIASLSSMVVLGTIVYLLYNRLLWVTGAYLQGEREWGTIEELMLTPSSRFILLLSVGVSSLGSAALWMGIMGMVSFAFFGFQIGSLDFLLVGVVLISTMASLLSLGMFFSGFFMLMRAASQVVGILQSPIRYLSGVSFPVSALEGPLQLVAYALPTTYGILALRMAFEAQASFQSVGANLVILWAFAIGFFAVSYVLLGFMERKAKRDGSLYFF